MTIEKEGISVANLEEVVEFEEDFVRGAELDIPNLVGRAIKLLPNRIRKNLPRYAAGAVIAVDVLVLSGVLDLDLSNHVKGIVIGIATAAGFSLTRQGVTPVFEDAEDEDIVEVLDDEIQGDPLD